MRLVRAGEIVSRGVIDTAGRYSVQAPAGDFVLVIDAGGGLFPTCPATPVVVLAATAVTVDVSCDTGIR